MEGGLLLGLVLAQQSLDTGDDLGRALDDVGNLLDGIGGVLHADVEHLNVAGCVDNQETDGLHGQAGAAACAEVLGLGVGIGLTYVIQAAGGVSHGNLGNGDDHGSRGMGVGGADDGVGVDEGLDVLQGSLDYERKNFNRQTNSGVCRASKK